VNGDPGSPGDGIKQGHLQTCPEVVVIPHDLCRVLANRFPDVLIPGCVPGVIEQPLANTDRATGEFHLEHLGVAPVGEFPIHGPPGSIPVGKTYCSAADVGDLQLRGSFAELGCIAAGTIDRWQAEGRQACQG